MSVCVSKNQAFKAMVIQHCIKKIAQRFNKYRKLFDHMDIYLPPIFQERYGIEKYLVLFQQLKPVIVKMLVVPAFRKDKKWMGYVLFVFRELHLARKGINFEALNNISFSDCPASIMYLLKTYP